jgi:hypothetical protein
MTDAPKPQVDKFRDLARQIGADEDEEAFKAKLRKIAKSPPRHREKATDKPK